MRTALLISAMLGLTAATPRPQNELDWTENRAALGPSVDAVMEPVTYDEETESQEAAIETLDDLVEPAKQKAKRGVNDDCAAQPDGFDPRPSEDAFSAFYDYAPFASTSQNAPTPHGYARNFVNLQAASNANSYLGLYTLKSGTYNTQKCSELREGVEICSGFNIYYERDSTVNPAPTCLDPLSFTNIKCTLWGSNINTATAVNKGQYRIDFHVVITGSNSRRRG